MQHHGKFWQPMSAFIPKADSGCRRGMSAFGRTMSRERIVIARSLPRIAMFQASGLVGLPRQGHLVDE